MARERGVPPSDDGLHVSQLVEHGHDLQVGTTLSFPGHINSI